jgi:hypothetical protein
MRGDPSGIRHDTQIIGGAVKGSQGEGWRGKGATAAAHKRSGHLPRRQSQIRNSKSENRNKFKNPKARNQKAGLKVLNVELGTVKNQAVLGNGRLKGPIFKGCVNIFSPPLGVWIEWRLDKP